MEGSLWRVCLKRLRAHDGFGYGLTIPTAWFEEQLAAQQLTQDFAFAMMRLREAIEENDGYYLEAATIRDKEGETQKVFRIPSAGEHEEVARGMERRLKKLSRRANDIRVATLNNPEAVLSDAEKNRMESAQRIAATRLVLLAREKSVVNALQKHAPKLLE